MGWDAGIDGVPAREACDTGPRASRPFQWECGMAKKVKIPTCYLILTVGGLSWQDLTVRDPGRCHISLELVD